jgi:UDP-N-acetylglucosamine acyltransferase
VLGTDPLDKNFPGERSYLRIGNRNTIREHYTISRGTQPESVTEIGDGNYIMTTGHIAHNCRIGNHTVICSGALVAGYVEVEDEAFISGGVVIHQFSKIGNTRVNADVPPFFLYSGFNVEPRGLNLVGLKRAGFSAGQIAALKNAYRVLYRSGYKLEEALCRIETEIRTPEVHHLVRFIRSSERGICRP